jgi:hypothetical protein
VDEKGYDFEAYDWPWTKTDIIKFNTLIAGSTQARFK